MPISEATYERIALEDPESNWELVCGRLRRKPEMTQEHNDVITLLGHYCSSSFRWIASLFGRTCRAPGSALGTTTSRM
jgi:hypothetical protein